MNEGQPANRDPRRRQAHAALRAAALGLPLLLLGGLLLFLAARADCWTDEGFTLRRVAASWRQLYFPLAHAADPRADPFDPQYVTDFNPPLYFVLARLALGAHPSLLVMRSLSMAGFFIGFGALALWARRALGGGGLTAIVFFYLLSPALLFYGHEARPYALPLGLAMACLAALWFQGRRPRGMFALCLVLGFCGPLMNFHLAWFTIGVGMVCGAFAVRPGDFMSRPAALAALAGLGLGALGAVGVILPQLRLLQVARGAESEAVTVASLLHLLALPFTGPLTSTRPAFRLPLLALWVAGVAPLAALGALGWRAVGRSRLRTASRVTLALWLIPPALMILAKLILGSPMSVRYAMVGLPGCLMFLAVMAQGALERGGVGRRLGAALVGVLAAVALLMSSLMVLRPMRQAWREPIATFLRSAAPGDAYAFDPEWLKSAFAVNAGSPPVARYCYLGDEPPAGIRRLWIFSIRQPAPEVAARLRGRGWRFDQAPPGDNIVLWLATRP